jgi:hypothetical protein
MGPQRPIEEKMRDLDDLVRAGKVRYVEFSKTPAWITASSELSFTGPHLPSRSIMCFNEKRLDTLSMYRRLPGRFDACSG